MAIYNPPQPFWKRAVVAILDFVLAFTAVGWLVARTIGSRPNLPSVSGGETNFSFSAKGFGFDIEGWPALVVFGLVVAYFLILGRTGGTIVQRLFGFKRA